MNRRKLLSLLLSILIHLSIFLVLFWVTHKTEKQLTSSGAKRVELSLKDFVTPPPAKSTPPPAPPAPPQPKTPPSPPRPPKKPTPNPAEKPAEKPVKKEAPKPKPKPVEKQPSPEPKPAPRPKPRPSPVKKPVARPKPVPRPLPKPKPKPAPEPKKTTPESALAGALGAPAVPQAPSRPGVPEPPSIDQINNTMSDMEFHALYKDEFDHFTPEQKKFIRSNLNRIQAITQHYLTKRGYPRFAVEQHMQGVNVVEFHLHPNGNISGLKVISSSGFSVLDDNSLDTIRAAYKDYPRPEETTKIRFYIQYRLY